MSFSNPVFRSRICLHNLRPARSVASAPTCQPQQCLRRMNVKRLERNAVWILTAAAIGGCSMPRAVSSYSDVQHASETGQIELVPVTAATLPVLPNANGGFP